MVLARKNLNKIFLWTLIFCIGFPTSANPFFLDWIWTENKNSEEFIKSTRQLKLIPFEYKTEDEEFLEEASKFTDLIKTSSLDICQHKVILQIQTSCSSMTEEELAKLSVNLLNCQSQVDGRRVFPCTESMSLKQCTKDMSPNIWNAYHLMNNRARTVCLTARRTQFQALSEITINKIMTTTRDQIQKMENLLEGQEKLESLTLGTLDSVKKGHSILMKEQESLKTAQKTIQDFVTFNLEQLTTEKALIAAGNKELEKLTRAIKQKLDEANQELNFQSEERARNHNKLLKDIEALQMQAENIHKRIDSSAEKLLTQQEIAVQNYKVAVDNIQKINNTVYYLVGIINATRKEIDDKLYWIGDFLHGTGNHIEKLISITFHIIYLLMGMLFASFLNFSITSRALLAIIVPLNLFITYNQGPERAMNFSQMTVSLVSTVIAVATIHQLYAIFSPESESRPYLDNNSRTNKLKDKSRASQTQSAENSRNIFSRIVQYLSSKLIYIWPDWKSSEISQSEGAHHNDEFNKSSSWDVRNERFDNWNERSPFAKRYERSSFCRMK